MAHDPQAITLSGMSVEANRAAAVSIFEEGWNRGQFAGLGQAIASTLPFHVHGRSRAMTLAEPEEIVASWRRGFSYLRRFVPHHVVAEGNLVAIRSALTGTNLGEWVGTAPSGNSVAVDHMFLMHWTKRGDSILCGRKTYQPGPRGR